MRVKLIILFLYLTGHNANAFILPPPYLSPSILRRPPPLVAFPLRCSAASSADVAEVLELVKDTDRGADARALPLKKRQRLYAVLDKLEAEGWAGPDVDGGLVASGGPGIGNFECIFVGEKDASSEVGQSGSSQAGGYWRGGLGRLLLQTVALYQNLVYCGEGEDGGEIPPYTLIGLQVRVCPSNKSFGSTGALVLRGVNTAHKSHHWSILIDAAPLINEHVPLEDTLLSCSTASMLKRATPARKTLVGRPCVVASQRSLWG